MANYVVLALMGKIILSLGPFYEVDTCKDMATKFQNRSRSHLEEFSALVSKPLEQKDVEADCIQSEKSPSLHNKQDKEDEEDE